MPIEHEINIEEVLEKCSWIWTTHRKEFYLVELKNSPNLYAIIRLHMSNDTKIVGAWGLSCELAYNAVKKRLIAEGIPIVTQDEMRKIQDQWLGRTE